MKNASLESPAIDPARNAFADAVVFGNNRPMTELAPLPGVASDETTTLAGFLDFYRSVLLRKAEGLDEAQVRMRLDPSPIDLLGLIRHMAVVEQWWFTNAFAGRDEPEWWEDPNDRDADWHHAETDTIAVALNALRTEIEKSRAIVSAAPSLDELTAIEVGPVDIPQRRSRRSLRWIIVHMIEEYARHCGHADLLREAADGAVGD